VQVIHHKGNNKSTLVDERKHQDRFWLEDHSGRALVEIGPSDVALHVDRRYTSGILDEPTPGLRDFLAARGHEGQGWIFNKNLEYQEAVLEPNEQVAVLGLCRWEPDPDPAPSGGEVGGYRDTRLRLTVKAPAGSSLLLSDDPAALERAKSPRRLAGGPRKPG
jgi:hypothetical protein